MLTQTLIPTSAQWLTSLDIENVAISPGGRSVTFLKFYVSNHRKIQQLRDKCSLVNSAITNTKNSFSTGVHIWKVPISRPFYRPTS